MSQNADIPPLPPSPPKPADVPPTPSFYSPQGSFIPEGPPSPTSARASGSPLPTGLPMPNPLETMTQLMVNALASQQLMQIQSQPLVAQQLLAQQQMMMGERFLDSPSRYARFPLPEVSPLSPTSLSPSTFTSRYGNQFLGVRGPTFDMPRSPSGGVRNTATPPILGSSPRWSELRLGESSTDSQITPSRFMSNPGGLALPAGDTPKGEASRSNSGGSPVGSSAAIPSSHNMVESSRSPVDEQDVDKVAHTAFSAVRHNKFETVESLVRDYPTLIDAVDESNKNNTMLHIACSNGYARLAKVLIKSGANVDAVNTDGNTPLHLCYQYGRHALISILIAAGANENARNKKDELASQLLASASGSSNRVSN